jgi:integrase/recombinase XerD
MSATSARIDRLPHALRDGEQLRQRLAGRTIVRSACRRAGTERVPAHRFRHALASDLLREGASMIDIGQVLRHKHMESTAIYAKVDLERLRLVASPWPGAIR